MHAGMGQSDVRNKLLAIIGVLVFANVSADTTDRTVRTVQHMSATPEQVIQAFLDNDELAAWWQVTRSLVDPEPGGVWAIAWDDWGADRTHHSWSGVIADIGPGRLVIENMVMIEPDMPLLGPMRLVILAKPDADGSSVTVTHSGYGYGGHWDEMYRLVVNGWGHVLGDMQTWFGEYD